MRGSFFFILNSMSEFLCNMTMYSFFFSGREFIHYIAEEIREKVAGVIAGAHFMSVLSDGSQARKTGSEKELVLVRTMKAGLPVYFVVSLLEMSSFGGCDADSLKKAIDSVFQKVDTHPTAIPMDDYRTKMVSATADGANVNLGKYNGVLTKMSVERPWLIVIHCMNHRIELAIKDMVKSTNQYEECDNFYKSIYYLFRNSGKLKSETKEACQALNITFYELPKIHGTRFVNHRRKGFKALLHDWPALITCFTNALSRDYGSRPETKAKIKGVLKKLKDYKMLCRVACYLDILESISPLSLIFEKKYLMAYEVKPAIEKTFANLEEMKGEDLNSAISSFLHKFSINEDDTNKVRITSMYPIAGHERRKLKNREFIEIELEEMTNADNSSIEAALKLRSTSIDSLVPLITDRFSSFTENEVINAMTWINPQLWEEDRSTNGFTSINKLIEVFSDPLDAAGFDRSKVFTEWKSLQSTVKSYYSHFTNFMDIWSKLFVHRKDEFPNILMLAEIVFSLSSSNSVVEKAFSTLTTLLTDRRLTMSHSTMEDCMVISGNSSVWTEKEKEQILDGATKKYLQKRRKTKVSSPCASQEVVPDVDLCDESSSDEYSSDDECFSDYESCYVAENNSSDDSD